MLSHERLLERLALDRDTGALTWRVPHRKIKAGAVAGRPTGKGYWRITIDGETYLAHRLVWFYTHGEWPAGQIDHIDGNRRNNAPLNLRDVPCSVNLQNRSAGTGGTGLLGVSFQSREQKYRAQIRVNGKRLDLGLFATAEAAQEAYLMKKRELHPGFVPSRIDLRRVQ